MELGWYTLSGDKAREELGTIYKDDMERKQIMVRWRRKIFLHKLNDTDLRPIYYVVYSDGSVGPVGKNRGGGHDMRVIFGNAFNDAGKAAQALLLLKEAIAEHRGLPLQPTGDND